MNKKTKNLLIVATLFVIIGIIIFGVAMTIMKWDFSKLSTEKYETNGFEVTEDFSNISIDVISADVVFVPSTGEKTIVTCYEKTKVKHAVSVIDGVLTISSEDTRKWYDYVSINFKKPKLTVSVPAGQYGALNIKNDTGDIEIGSEFSFATVNICVSTGAVKFSASSVGLTKIEGSTSEITLENVTLGALEVKVSTGKIVARDLSVLDSVSISVSTGETELKNVYCKNLISSGRTGDIELENVVASGIFDIKRSTGDVEFTRCDAMEIYVTTSTGDVEGSFLSDKVFITGTSSGKISVPQSITGGRCEIKTSTGNIKISIVWYNN